MKPPVRMLSAIAEGRFVAIGQDSIRELRRLSDHRLLLCAACAGPVVLKAGAVIAAHFAHLPGAVCRPAASEPETEAHRAGKEMLARWIRACLPASVVQMEADLPDSGQRADLLVRAGGEPIALEYQCAEISAREWRRRNALYRASGVRDLWLLGVGSWAGAGAGALSEMERAMLRDGAPLLYLDARGDRWPAGSLARRRNPAAGGRAGGSIRMLMELPFPWNLLDWPLSRPAEVARRRPPTDLPREWEGDHRLRAWLKERWQLPEDRLAPFFGIAFSSCEAIACSPHLWQACLYYRFIHGQAGRSWWIRDVETWARRYLPLAQVAPRPLRRALLRYQDILCAAGLLSSTGATGSGRVEADFQTLGAPPDPAAALRLAEYRRTLRWDNRRP